MGASDRRFGVVSAALQPERRRMPRRLFSSIRPVPAGHFPAGGLIMAYDRYETRDAPRDERSRWPDDGGPNRSRSAFSQGDNRSDRGRQDDRGFWDRASDEVASWFGDEDAERRRRQDQQRDERERGWSGRDRDRDYDRGYGRDWNRDHDRDRSEDRRNWYETRGMNERGG